MILAVFYLHYIDIPVRLEGFDKRRITYPTQKEKVYCIGFVYNVSADYTTFCFVSFGSADTCTETDLILPFYNAFREEVIV